MHQDCDYSVTIFKGVSPWQREDILKMILAKNISVSRYGVLRSNSQKYTRMYPVYVRAGYNKQLSTFGTCKDYIYTKKVNGEEIKFFIVIIII